MSWTETSNNPQVHLEMISNPKCSPIKMKKAEETKVKPQINFQEFCSVFRVFASKRRNPQTIMPFVCSINVINVVQSHLQHSICQLWEGKGKQLSLLLIEVPMAGSNTMWFMVCEEKTFIMRFLLLSEKQVESFRIIFKFVYGLGWLASWLRNYISNLLDWNCLSF